MIELMSLEEEAGKRWLAWVLSPSSAAAAAARSRQSCATPSTAAHQAPIPGIHPLPPAKQERGSHQER